MICFYWFHWRLLFVFRKISFGRNLWRRLGFDECQRQNRIVGLYRKFETRQLISALFIAPKMQEDHNNVFLYLFSTLLTALVAFKYYISRHFHKRMTHLRQRRHDEVPQEKIIVAVEPNNLLFKFSTTYKAGYREIEVSQSGWRGTWAKVLRFLGKGYFYRLKDSKRNLVNFMETLTENQKIQLFLYTTLPIQVVEIILSRQGLLKYFPESFRRSCKEITCGSIKHPIEVDIHTKRVVILTGSKDDHLEEDNKYFLVIKQREMSLTKTSRFLIKLANNNQEIDELHNQLAVFKAHIESEPQVSC